MTGVFIRVRKQERERAKYSLIAGKKSAFCNLISEVSFHYFAEVY